MDRQANVTLAIAAAMLLTGCGQERGAAPASAPKVLPGAVVVMQRDQWPDTYRQLGHEAFTRANRIQPAMAEMLAGRGECDQLEYLGLSTQSTAQELLFYGDCKNGRRVTGSEREIQS